MPAQRKVFRIEEMLRGAQSADPSPAASHSAAEPIDMMAEIRALRTLILAQQVAVPAAPAPVEAQKAQIGEARKLKVELDVIGDAIRQTKSEISTLQDRGFDGARVARIAHELKAVVNGTEKATDQILKAAEGIDEIAATLCAALKNQHERGMAEDIQDRVTEIFEACNFHDLTGQRISKVVATLQLVEDHIARMSEIWSVVERFNADDIPAGTVNLINGPKLDGEPGHSSQDEIDALFH
jgi:chemotaxis protein CheZ